MKTIKRIRQHIIQELWQAYYLSSQEMQLLAAQLKLLNIQHFFLDHFALIDLPSAHSGMETMAQLFHILGYKTRGQDYLPDKHNPFMWLAEEDSNNLHAKEVLPQIVVADFRLQELAPEVRTIIERYVEYIEPLDFSTIKMLLTKAMQNDELALAQLTQCILNYFKGRSWPLPTKSEFEIVRAHNELLAWVLVFGRKPNHFTLSIHLLDYFNDLSAFNSFIAKQMGFTLNAEGGLIKGGIDMGIAQSSTGGAMRSVALADGYVEMPQDFIEFVWRYPVKTPPVLWQDYFTHFIPQHANRVVESLYQNKALSR